MYENPELRKLFTTYSNTKAPGRHSIADHLSVLSLEEHRHDVLIVATGTDVAIYPGGGARPQVRGFRVNIPGFTELTAVSHFGPAIASIVAIKERGHEELWRADAEELLEDTRRVRAAHSAAMWRDDLAVEAFRGREDVIAAMTDYACAISERYLERALGEPGYANGRSLREDLLDGSGPDLPVSCNRIMIATFSLYALDFTHGLIRWLEGLEVDWAHTLFAIAGRQGRPTGGTTKSTTNMVRIMDIVSHGALTTDRMFVAPHLPVFATPQGDDLDEVIALEEPIRWQLARVMSSAELAPLMFEGYPEFVEPPLYGPALAADATTVSEMPRIRSADDWQTMFTRLRLSLEDPRQLLASGVTDFVAAQLAGNGNDPSAVTIPGLDGEPYPPLTPPVG
jgi:hypothetical protein